MLGSTEVDGPKQYANFFYTRRARAIEGMIKKIFAYQTRSLRCSASYKNSFVGQTLYPIATQGKGSGQTPIAVWSQPVLEFLGPVIGLEWW